MGMVVAPQAMATDIGSQVLARGGNAVDAALTAAMAQGVLDPLNCGLGGFGCMVVYCADDSSWRSLSFHARAGSLVKEDMWAEVIEEEYVRGADGFRLEGYVNDIGYQSIATPGTVSGFAAALEALGSQDWRSTIEPTVPLAVEGYRLTPKARVVFRPSSFARGLHPAVRGTATPAARAIFTRDGHTLWQEGDLFVQEDYGNTLLRLAEWGPDEFYRGRLAERISTDIGRGGGFVTLADLSGYQPEWGTPLVGNYRGYGVFTAPPPASGLILLEMLQLAERFEVARMAHSSPEHLDLVARIMRWGCRDRALYLGDPAFSRVEVDELLSVDRTTEAQALIESGADIVVPRWKPAETGTTQVCVVDGSGNLVSLTHSLGAASGVVTAGLGFQYNNAMNCFDPVPHRPNSLAPGKARVSGITPSILDDGCGTKIVVGAPGGAMITNAVFQVISNIIDFGMSATEAVSAPRIDCQGEAIDVEARISAKTCDGLARRGNRAQRSVASYWDYPQVHAVVVHALGHRLDGGADPRGEGSVLWE